MKNICNHSEKVIKVIEVFGTCEITVEQCSTCKKELTERKTECS